MLYEKNQKIRDYMFWNNRKSKFDPDTVSTLEVLDIVVVFATKMLFDSMRDFTGKYAYIRYLVRNMMTL